MGRKGRKNTREQRTYTKIIGEGITEKYYSKKVKAEFNTDWKVEKRHFRASSPKALYELAVEELKLGHTIYCLVDKDKARAGDKTAKEYIEKLEKLDLENDKFTLCSTMPCIEYWFLAHYKNTEKYFANDNAVIKELKSYIPNYDKTEKYLNTDDLEKHVLKGSDHKELKQAIQYCKAHPNGESHSTMYKLFKDIPLE